MPWVKFSQRQVLFREAVLSFLGVAQEEQPKDVGHKDIGWYCKGHDVQECSKLFGAALSKVCQTCPD